MNNDNHRGRTSLKLLTSLRGAGSLRWVSGAVQVTYQLDLYERRNGRVASGSIDGDLAVLGEETAARLQLAGGMVLPITLLQVEEDNAMFENRGDLPEPLLSGPANLDGL